MAHSSIEWTEMTWNPTMGCNKVSAGCKFCAEVMSRRLQADLKSAACGESRGMEFRGTFRKDSYFL